MYYQVHIIAYYYGWGEKDILSLPVFKRRKYYDLIAQQVKAENGGDEEDNY